MSSFKDKLKKAGQAIAQTAKDVGHKVAEGTGKAVDYVKEKTGLGPNVSAIKEQMDVIAWCGKKVGVVDRVEGKTIKLTVTDGGGGEHRYIPVSWVERVDSQVHLNKNSAEILLGWKSDAASCGDG
jgi:hypothetical protein